MEAALEFLQANLVSLNADFLLQAPKLDVGTWFVMAAFHSSDVKPFFATNCNITAHAIRWQLSHRQLEDYQDTNWKFTDSLPSGLPCFQVSLDGDEHIFTVFSTQDASKSFVIQSCFDRYPPTCRLISGVDFTDKASILKNAPAIVNVENAVFSKVEFLVPKQTQ